MVHVGFKWWFLCFFPDVLSHDTVEYIGESEIDLPKGCKRLSRDKKKDKQRKCENLMPRILSKTSPYKYRNNQPEVTPITSPKSALNHAIPNKSKQLQVESTKTPSKQTIQNMKKSPRKQKLQVRKEDVQITVCHRICKSCGNTFLCSCQVAIYPATRVKYCNDQLVLWKKL